MYNIRYLEERDRRWVIDIAARRTIIEDLKKPNLYNEDQLNGLFSLAVCGNHAFVCERNGEVVGLVAGIRHGHLFNPNVELVSTLFWYVLPEYREGRSAYLLLKRYRKSLDDENIWCVFSTQEYSSAKEETFSRFGFSKGENIYRYGDINGS